MDLGVAPVKRYMLRYAREKDLAVFASAGMAVRPQRKEDLPIQVVVPAYILSELKAGFQIGAVLFLPFLAGGSCGGERYDLDRHDATATGGDLDAFEDSSVCDGGWLEFAGRSVD